jgi:hypothetical protein
MLLLISCSTTETIKTNFVYEKYPRQSEITRNLEDYRFYNPRISASNHFELYLNGKSLRSFNGDTFDDMTYSPILNTFIIPAGLYGLRVAKGDWEASIYYNFLPGIKYHIEFGENLLGTAASLSIVPDRNHNLTEEVLAKDYELYTDHKMWEKRIGGYMFGFSDIKNAEKMFRSGLSDSIKEYYYGKNDYLQFILNEKYLVPPEGVQAGCVATYYWQYNQETNTKSIHFSTPEKCLTVVFRHIDLEKEAPSADAINCKDRKKWIPVLNISIDELLKR